VERWLAAWNPHQPERLLELTTDDIVYDDSSWPQTMRGHAPVRELLDFLRRAFPDFTIEGLGGPLVASDGPRCGVLVARARDERRPDQSARHPGYAKLVEFEGADFEEYRDGKVARLRLVLDMADISRQMAGPP
jgi:steroid delta-isomerase-like uncharacterized protein